MYYNIIILLFLHEGRNDGFGRVLGVWHDGSCQQSVDVSAVTSHRVLSSTGEKGGGEEEREGEGEGGKGKEERGGGRRREVCIAMRVLGTDECCCCMYTVYTV